MKEQEDKKFQRAFIVSAILHLILLGVFFLGFPSVFEKLPEEKDLCPKRGAHDNVPPRIDEKQPVTVLAQPPPINDEFTNALLKEPPPTVDAKPPDILQRPPPIVE